MKAVLVTGVVCATILGTLAILHDTSLSITASAGTFVLVIGASKLLP